MYVQKNVRLFFHRVNINVADNIIPNNIGSHTYIPNMNKCIYKLIDIWYVIFKKLNFMFLMDKINMPSFA